MGKPAFDQIYGAICDRVLDTRSRSGKNALAMLLIKLRMDISQTQIGVLFGLDQQRVSEAIDQVSLQLNQHFVPHYLGYQHISKTDLAAQHSTVLSSVLTRSERDQAVVILDGTYFYVQKSSNFQLQKETWSMQKDRNLVKGMVVCAPDGYIIEVEGLYKSDGHNNDAAILNTMLNNRTAFDRFFADGRATLVLDR